MDSYDIDGAARCALRKIERDAATMMLMLFVTARQRDERDTRCAPEDCCC